MKLNFPSRFSRENIAVQQLDAAAAAAGKCKVAESRIAKDDFSCVDRRNSAAESKCSSLVVEVFVIRKGR